MKRLGWSSLVMSLSCALVVEPQPGAGIGASCEASSECQAAECLDGLCTVRCFESAGCPGGTLCANEVCQLPLSALVVVPYDTAQDEVGQAVDRGVVQAAEQLGYVEPELVSKLELPSATYEEVEQRLDQQFFDLVIVGSPALSPGSLETAKANPGTTFVALQLDPANAAGNLVSFDARSYQAYFLAGVAAGRLTNSGRLGFVGSTPTPPFIASVNAFALGAQAGRGAPITLELRWMMGPHDMGLKVDGKSKERRDTEEMVAAGADVIAHNVDNNIPVFTVRDLNEAGASVLAVASHKPEACGIVAAGDCVGAVVTNWTPLFSRIIDLVHRGEPPSGSLLEPMRTSNAESVVRFDLGTGLAGGSSLAAELESLRAELASDSGVGRVFDGPIQSTGQCESASGLPSCVEAGTRLSDEGLASICWLVAGIIDETGAPAMVPESASCPAP